MKNSIEIEYAKLGLLRAARQDIATEAQAYNERLAETIRQHGGQWIAPNGAAWVLDEDEQPVQAPLVAIKWA